MGPSLSTAASHAGQPPTGGGNAACLRIIPAKLEPGAGGRWSHSIQGISQEGTQGTDGAQLDGEAKTVVITATLDNQRAVDVVDKEAPLQLRSARWIDETSVARGLVVVEELDGHAA